MSKTLRALPLVALFSIATATAAQADTVTSLASPIPAGTSWGIIAGENTGGGTAAITTTAARSGNGSIELRGDRTRVQTGVQYAPFTTNIGLLDTIQSLTFDWQVAADSARLNYTPALRLLVQDGSTRSELIWEGAYNPGATQGTLASNNAAGQWYSSNATDVFWQFVAGVGPNETGGTLQLKTLQDWATYYTNAGAYISAISVGAGSGATLGYHAFVDNVVFTTTDGVRSYNFEATAVPEPATWAMMLVGFGMMGASLRVRRRAAAAIA